ncbi:MAG: nucleoside deaminase [Opitutae bacterium]|nr:nucleoside deaminase [Opitutae bacterium]MCD8298477.1 nucleoside deaminase [Opitutae bacterium]
MQACPFQKVFPSELVRDDAYFMALAFNEAIAAWNEDEVPVGAVVARGGIVIAAAHNRTIAATDPTAHAEMIAITQAARAVGDWRLNECTLYVTKEPCPMCSGAMIVARLGRVVFAWGDPKMGCLGGVTALQDLPQTNHRPVVASGVMEQECRDLIQAYFRLKRTQA